MAENLRVTRYADKTPVMKVENATDWNNLSTTDSAYCYYENDSAGNAAAYGALYTWATATRNTGSSSNPSNVQGICPDGWHLPSDDEWIDLEMALGMTQTEADAFNYRGTNEGSKLAGYSDLWIDGLLKSDPEFGSSGFNATPGGRRDADGTYSNKGSFTYLWSTTIYIPGSSAYIRAISRNNTEVYRQSGSIPIGRSVRCVKD